MCSVGLLARGGARREHTLEEAQEQLQQPLDALHGRMLANQIRLRPRLRCAQGAPVEPRRCGRRPRHRGRGASFHHLAPRGGLLGATGQPARVELRDRGFHVARLQVAHHLLDQPVVRGVAPSQREQLLRWQRAHGGRTRRTRRTRRRGRST